VLQTGDVIEYMLPGIEVTGLEVVAMRTEKGEEISRANPGNRVFLPTEPLLSVGVKNGILRRQDRAEHQDS
jgi:putative protease